MGCALSSARLCLHLQRYKEGVFRLVSVAHLYRRNRLREHESEHENGIFDDKRWPVAALFFLLPMQRHNYEVSRLIYPDASAIYHLWVICAKLKVISKSVHLITKALRFQRFDFGAFQELLRMGVKVAVKSLYKAPTQRFFCKRTSTTVIRESRRSFSKPDIPAVPNPLPLRRGNILWLMFQHLVPQIRFLAVQQARLNHFDRPWTPALARACFPYTKKPDSAHPDNQGLKRAIQSERPYVEPVVELYPKSGILLMLLRRLYVCCSRSCFKCFGKGMTVTRHPFRTLCRFQRTRACDTP